MKAVSTVQMRAMDREAIDERGIPGSLLMERAGRGVASAVLDLAERQGQGFPHVRFVAGKGNNGGDAFAAARILFEEGVECEVWLCAKADDMQGDAADHLKRMQEAGVSLREMPNENDWKALADDLDVPPCSMLVDGLLGTGFRGEPREPLASAITYINSLSRFVPVVAIDIPSGVNGDSGEVVAEAVVADVTVTMARPKSGLLCDAALDYVGNVEVVDIGLNPPKEEDPDAAAIELITPADLYPLIQRLPRRSHKGTCGKLLLIGGSSQYSGAITLAAAMAVHAGAGLVHVWVPHAVRDVVAAGVPEAIVNGVDQTDEGSIRAAIWGDCRSVINEFDAVLVGPGMTRGRQITEFMRNLLRECSVPLLVDADGIATFTSQPHWFEKAHCPMVITPHPGELSTLFGQEIQDILANRVGICEAASKFMECSVVLKGANTVVAHPEHATHINLSGNPGMATGGSGDVLGGLIAALMGRGVDPFDAARIGVYVHGRAGDRVAWRKSQAGLSAMDLVEEIPYALREVIGR